MIHYNQLSIITDLTSEDITSIIDTTTQSSIVDGTINYPQEIDTFEEKKEYLLNEVILKDYNTNDRFWFKRTINGRIVSINGGFINNGYFVCSTWLIDTVDDSKRWIYIPEVIAQQKQFLKEHGCIGFLAVTIKGKSAHFHVRERYQSMGDYCHNDEDIGENLVYTRIDFTK